MYLHHLPRQFPLEMLRLHCRRPHLPRSQQLQPILSHQMHPLPTDCRLRHLLSRRKHWPLPGWPRPLVSCFLHRTLCLRSFCILCNFSILRCGFRRSLHIFFMGRSLILFLCQVLSSFPLILTMKRLIHFALQPRQNLQDLFIVHPLRSDHTDRALHTVPQFIGSRHDGAIRDILKR